MASTKISLVSFRNTLPFEYGLKHSGLDINLSKDVPSMAAYKLKEGLVDIGLVPVASLHDYKHFHIISDYCIGSDGPVKSVMLYANKPIEKLKQIVLDSNSVTSNMLLRVLLRQYWKLNIELLREPSNTEDTGYLLIGDKTFDDSLSKFEYQYDLSEYWKKLTQLPFVFALWISLKPVSEEFIKVFNSALAIGLEKLPELIKPYNNLHKGLTEEEYFEQCIRYQFDAKMKVALAKFLEWSKD
jgi:chorismate dehydratase